MKKLTKSDLLKRIESLEGFVVSLEEKIDFLKADLHQTHNPYTKVGSKEWQEYAKKFVKNIHIHT